MGKKVFSIAGIVVGLISVIMSFVVNGAGYSSYESHYTYGGDAYTGIQNAAANTANNVGNLIDLVELGMFCMLFVFGLACIVYFGMKLMEAIQEAPSADKPASTVSFKSRLDIPDVKKPEEPAAPVQEETAEKVETEEPSISINTNNAPLKL